MIKGKYLSGWKATTIYHLKSEFFWLSRSMHWTSNCLKFGEWNGPHAMNCPECQRPFIIMRILTSFRLHSRSCRHYTRCTFNNPQTRTIHGCPCLRVVIAAYLVDQFSFTFNLCDKYWLLYCLLSWSEWLTFGDFQTVISFDSEWIRMQTNIHYKDFEEIFPINICFNSKFLIHYV